MFSINCPLYLSTKLTVLVFIFVFCIEFLNRHVIMFFSQNLHISFQTKNMCIDIIIYFNLKSGD